MKHPNKANPKIGFEVRCSCCDLFELWGLEQAIRALTASGKLSPAADFDAELFSELFLVHANSLACPSCRSLNSLEIHRAVSGDWDWEDAVYCEDCGEEIPPARLQAVPETTLCIRCQQKQEQYITNP